MLTSRSDWEHRELDNYLKWIRQLSPLFSVTDQRESFRTKAQHFCAPDVENDSLVVHAVKISGLWLITEQTQNGGAKEGRRTVQINKELRVTRFAQIMILNIS